MCLQLGIDCLHEDINFVDLFAMVFINQMWSAIARHLSINMKPNAQTNTHINTHFAGR